MLLTRFNRSCFNQHINNATEQKMEKIIETVTVKTTDGRVAALRAKG